MDDVEALQRAVLPPGVEVRPGAAPPPPDDWEDGYVLPAHFDKPLLDAPDARHPRDADLAFYEGPHVYTFRGVPTSASVTALAHAFEKPFVPSEAIASMKLSRAQAWPRREYVVEAEGAWTPSRGALLVRGGRTVATAPPHSLDDAATEEGVLAMLRATAAARRAGGEEEDDEVVVYERAMADGEIERAWKRKGRIASHRGTDAHWQAECFFNGLPFRWWEAEMRVVLDFVRDHLAPRGIVARSTELELVCVDADVAGSVDLVLRDPATGTHHIVDHKRSDKLRAQLRGYGKMAPPFGHLDDCKGAAYALQTSLYQRILERDYGWRFGERVLLSLHPDAPFCTAVPYLRAEADYVLAKRFALVRARRAVAASDPGRFACSLTGAPLFDAVVLEDGSHAMEKAALVRGLPHQPAAERRAAFEAAVEEALGAEEAPTLEAAACKSWRRLVPEDGIVPTWE